MATGDKDKKTSFEDNPALKDVCAHYVSNESALDAEKAAIAELEKNVTPDPSIYEKRDKLEILVRDIKKAISAEVSKHNAGLSEAELAAVVDEQISQYKEYISKGGSAGAAKDTTAPLQAPTKEQNNEILKAAADAKAQAYYLGLSEAEIELATKRAILKTVEKLKVSLPGASDKNWNYTGADAISELEKAVAEERAELEAKVKEGDPALAGEGLQKAIEARVEAHQQERLAQRKTTFVESALVEAGKAGAKPSDKTKAKAEAAFDKLVVDAKQGADELVQSITGGTQDTTSETPVFLKKYLKNDAIRDGSQYIGGAALGVGAIQQIANGMKRNESGKRDVKALAFGIGAAVLAVALAVNPRMDLVGKAQDRMFR